MTPRPRQGSSTPPWPLDLLGDPARPSHPMPLTVRPKPSTVHPNSFIVLPNTLVVHRAGDALCTITAIGRTMNVFGSTVSGGQVTGSSRTGGSSGTSGTARTGVSAVIAKASGKPTAAMSAPKMGVVAAVARY